MAIDFASDLVADSRKTQSTDGTITLQWVRPDEGGKVEVQQSSSSSFADPVSRYSGVKGGSVLTGTSRGDTLFPNPCHRHDCPPRALVGTTEVQVEFMERGRLYLLLTLGGSVAVLTVGAILAGHLRTRGND